jgi:peptidoglycan/xylan/chitin deacetylase (PgdA/CDA1 family)
MAFLKLIPFLLILSLVFIPSYSVSAYSVPSCQCVAFRLDDIQDHWLNSVQTKIIDTFQEKNASLTIGIIGNHIGQDPKIIDDIKSKLGKNPKLEIANHGWNHEDFTKFSREEQYVFMKNTNDKINSLFGVVPSVFIPPFNTINNDTMAAFFENNFQYISADVLQDSPSFPIKNGMVYHVPGTGQTGKLVNNNSIWQHYNHQHVFVATIASIQKYGYAVIVLHPQEYAIRIHSDYVNEVDKNQIQNLGLLLDDIKNSGMKIILLNQIPLNSNNKPNPGWLNHVFSWYENGKISDDQVLTNINYLISKKIIKL